jgi:hypothetical protein
MAQNFAGFAATFPRTKPLVMVITRIGGKPFFAEKAFAVTAFHIKHRHKI